MKNLGDGLMVVFGSASAALACGVAMQQGVERDNRGRDASVGLRIGLSGGGVSPEDGDYFGDPVVEAARLCTMCDLVPLIETMITDAPVSAQMTKAVLATAYAQGERVEDARRLLDELSTTGFALPMDAIWIAAIASYAEAAIAVGDQRYAGPLFDQLAPWSDQLSTAGGATALGPVSHYVGGLATTLGRYDEANEYFARSAAQSERIGAAFFASRTNLEWGKMLAERRAPGDAERARELLSKTQDAAAVHGYQYVEGRSAAALQRLDS